MLTRRSWPFAALALVWAMGGAVLAHSQGAPGDRMVSVPERITGTPGQTVQVEIRIGNADGVLGYFFRLGYDPSVLEFTGAQSGSLTGSWGAPLANAANGTVTAAAAGAAPAAGSGTLAVLSFRALGGACASSLSFAAVELNDGAIPADWTNGFFECAGIQPTPAVSTPTPPPPFPTPTQPAGGIAVAVPELQGQAGSGVTVPVTISGAAGVTGYFFELTYNPEHLTFVFAAKGSLTEAWSDPVLNVEAGRIRAAAAGAVELTGGGSLAELRFSIRAGVSAGRIELNLARVELNDGALPVSVRNGGITMGGAVPPTPTVPPVFPTNTPPPVPTPTVPPIGGPEALISVPHLQAGPGQGVLVPLNLANAAGVTGYFAEIQYDSTLLRYVSSTKGDLAQSWGDPVVNAADGAVRVANAGASPLNGSGALVSMLFRVEANAAPGLFSPLSIVRAELNDGALRVNAQNGSVRVQAGPVPTPTPMVQPTATPGVQPSPTPTSPPGPGGPAPAIRYEFAAESLAANGWGEIPGGFTGAPAGRADAQRFVGALIPSSRDQVGIGVTVQPGQVAFLAASEPIASPNGHPVLLRAAIRADRPGASVYLFALDGGVFQGTAGGTLSYSSAVSAGRAVADEYCPTTLIDPPGGGVVTPAFQLAAAGDETVTVFIDWIEAYIVDPAAPFPANLLGNRCDPPAGGSMIALGAAAPESVYEFAGADMAANGWGVIPGGFLGSPPGDVIASAFVGAQIPSSADKAGLRINVDANEVAFIHALDAVDTGGGPWLMKLRLRVSGGNASLFLAGLKGSLSQGTADGSIGLNNIVRSEPFAAQEGEMILLYQPDAGERFAPAVQVASGGDSPSVFIDRLELIRVPVD